MSSPGRRVDNYQVVTDRIVGALERGVAPWACPWKKDVNGDVWRPRNGRSGRRYQGLNVLMLGYEAWAKDYPDGRWYTFKQAKQLGGYVRKGEKAAPITFWKFIKKPPVEGEDESSVRTIPILRRYSVFNRSQVNWPQEQETRPPEPQDEPTHDAASLVAATGADVRHGGNRAFYRPGSDFIRLPEHGQFNSDGDYWSTLLHELSHWTGHEDRCARTLNGRFGSQAYAAEELVAELGAAFLCHETGIQAQLQHPEYIGHWIKTLKNDNRAVFTAARLAREATEHVLDYQKGAR